jgi:hypothetical protein
MGDCSKYSINCFRWNKRITSCGSIAETLFHAPIAIVEWRYGNSRPGVPLEDYFKLLHLKSQSYKQLKNWKTNQVNPCAHMVANLVSKWDPKIARNSRISWENRDFPSPKLRFSSHHTKFDFLQRLSNFQEIQENLLQRLSNFFNRFPLSSTAFHFLQRLSDFQEIQEILLQRLSDFFNGFPISSTPFC